MASALGRPEDILVSYDPGVTSLSNQAQPLEVIGGSLGDSSEIGDDSNYEDFTSSLREFVSAQRAISGSQEPGSTLVGGWFGGTGADPSAVVLGLDWLGDPGDNSDGDSPDGDNSDGDNPDGGLLSYIVDSEQSESSPVSGEKEKPDDNGLLSYTVDSEKLKTVTPTPREKEKPDDNGLLSYTVDSEKPKTVTLTPREKEKPVIGDTEIVNSSVDDGLLPYIIEKSRMEGPVPREKEEPVGDHNTDVTEKSSSAVTGTGADNIDTDNTVGPRVHTTNTEPRPVKPGNLFRPDNVRAGDDT